MTPERYNRIGALFLEARCREGAARRSYLCEACGDDASLIGAVEKLLAQDAGPADGSASALHAETPDGRLDLLGLETSAAPCPERLGSFTIQGVLGQGAMGVVYRARQERPARPVALKVIRPGWATARMIRRFELEAAALARLRHPGIAQIYEAGTLQVPGLGAQPYFAMELVEGPPLTDYARQNALSVAARVELMIKVCEAVQHAHLRGIIHRDLKPANILVVDDGAGDGGKVADAPPTADTRRPTPPGRPKVLDFGVARLADADGQSGVTQTESGVIVGTLGYMSPEQAAGDAHDVDTRSDVYALGAIAYLLLSGRLPLDLSDKPLDEAVREIREREPPRLGTLDRTLKGDVETIIAKALEKDRSRRYASAGELGADLQRLLRHEPIAARPATALYQLGRLARRHRLLVAGAGATLGALVLGTAGTTWQMVRAMRAESRAEERAAAEAFQRTRAEAEAANSEAASAFLRDVFASADPLSAGRHDITVREAMDLAVQRLDAGHLRDRPEVEAVVRSAIGRTYSVLGRPADAEAQLRVALESIARLEGPVDIATATTLAQLSAGLVQQGRFAEAEPPLRRALATHRDKLGADDRETIVCTVILAEAVRGLGRLDEAESLLGPLLAGAEAHGYTEPTALAADALGNLYLQSGRVAEAEPLLRAVLQFHRMSSGGQHPSVAAALHHLGEVLMLKGDYAQGEAMIREALELTTAIYGDDHPAVAAVMLACARPLIRQGRFEEAEPLVRGSLERHRRLMGDDHPEVGKRRNNLAIVLQGLGRLDDAESELRAAIRTMRSGWPDEHPDVRAAIDNLASLLEARGKPEEAAALRRDHVAGRDARK